ATFFRAGQPQLRGVADEPQVRGAGPPGADPADVRAAQPGLGSGHDVDQDGLAVEDGVLDVRLDLGLDVAGPTDPTRRVAEVDVHDAHLVGVDAGQRVPAVQADGIRGGPAERAHPGG